MRVGKKYLYLTAALMWGIPGILITFKGIRAYYDVPIPQIGWLMILTGFILLMFHRIFRQLVKRYSNHIIALPEKNTLWQTFPIRAWIMIFFMMGLGLTFKLILFIPIQFTAFFYSGLGPMLIVSSFRFLQRM